jgi:hypothetical protein
MMAPPQFRSAADIEDALDKLGAAQSLLMRDGLTPHQKALLYAQVDAAAVALIGHEAWHEAWSACQMEALLRGEQCDGLARVATARAAIEAAGAAASPDVPSRPEPEW